METLHRHRDECVDVNDRPNLLIGTTTTTCTESSTLSCASAPDVRDRGDSAHVASVSTYHDLDKHGHQADSPTDQPNDYAGLQVHQLGKGNKALDSDKASVFASVSTCSDDVNENEPDLTRIDSVGMNSVFESDDDHRTISQQNLVNYAELARIVRERKIKDLMQAEAEAAARATSRVQNTNSESILKHSALPLGTIFVVVIVASVVMWAHENKFL